MDRTLTLQASAGSRLCPLGRADRTGVNHHVRIRRLERLNNGVPVAQLHRADRNPPKVAARRSAPADGRLAKSGQLGQKVGPQPSARSCYENLHDPQFPPGARRVWKSLRKTVWFPADLRPTASDWKHPASALPRTNELRFSAHKPGLAPMKIREIPLDDLVLDQNLNLRDRLDDFTVERYADSWERLPPITVYNIDERLLVADGFHRHAAAVMLGKRTIRAEIREGTFTDALDFVASINLFHGLPLTRSERRRAVEVKLKLHHDWSDRRMAEELAVSRELIAKIRRQLIEAHKIPNLPGRVGADGKLYTSAGLPKDAGEKLPKEPVVPDEESAERGKRAMGTAAAPPAKGEAPVLGKPTRVADKTPAQISHDDPRYIGDELSAEVGAVTIDEMLDFMAKQIVQLINWTNADGFMDAYKRFAQRTRGVPYRSHQTGGSRRPAPSRLILFECDKSVTLAIAFTPARRRHGRRGRSPAGSA